MAGTEGTEVNGIATPSAASSGGTRIVIIGGECTGWDRKVYHIETHFPGFAGKRTVLDVATPATYDRYCNAHRGAFMAFFPTIGSRMMAHTGRIKGIDNLELSGQWLQPPGGLPIAVVTGKDSIQRLCRKLRRPFVSEVPR
jgi:hypothetical protein